MVVCTFAYVVGARYGSARDVLGVSSIATGHAARLRGVSPANAQRVDISKVCEVDITTLRVSAVTASNAVRGVMRTK